ncbi:hypothetical protein FB451DRAFT_432988 [Mycena latifolia]|nr:hypothetical protein FB451DRAFT_432988 [Mycena latifolia]
MEDMPPTKRRRTGADAPETAFVRSEEYWFDDGNVILQVESTQFRLTKSILSLHSTVFRDMFMVPLPADEPTIENCPVVILTGDTPEDWTHLLGAMYPTRLPEGPPRIDLIAAVLRLGKKYDFQLFRQDCLRRLKTEFPTTLTEFDYNANWELIEEEEDIWFSLLSLAREIDLHSILPSIYYHVVCSQNAMRTVLNAKDESLSPADRLACLQGYVKLLELQSRTTMAWLDVDGMHIPHAHCRHFDDCDDALKAIIHDMSKQARPKVWAVDQWQSDWGDDLCGGCRREAKDVFERGRKRCWKKLPSVFGLPVWEKLESLDFE